MSSTPPLDAEKAYELLRVRVAELEQSLAGSLCGVEDSHSDDIRHLFGTLIEALPLLVAILSPNGRIIYINSPGCVMLHRRREQMRDVAVTEIYTPESYVALLDEGLYTAQTRGIWRSEAVLRTGTSAELPVSQIVTAHRRADGELKFFALIARDITARHDAEQIAQEQAALIEKAHDAIIVKDLGDSILRWSAGAERIYGWTAAEAVGRKASDLLGIDPGTYADALRATVEKGNWSGEIIKKGRAGKTLTIDARWTLVRNHRGDPHCLLCIDADVTHQKTMEMQFLRAQRMESIGTLAGGIAHDLNNILAPITMGIGLLRLKTTDPASLATIDTMDASTRRGAELVRQVLSFARGTHGIHGPLSLALVAREMHQIISETFPKSIETRVEMPADLWMVEGDVTQLHQVLLNLCVNARDAMADGGFLGIKLQNIVLDENYAAMNPGAHPGPYVVLEVSDTGCGIPPEIRTKIFEPFFTTKPAEVGTGLGLSTVFAVVKGHRGFINVYSEVGKGTQIKVYLPARAGSHTALPERANENLPCGAGEIVLVVEDEESIATLTQRTLERFGYKTKWARHGAEAVALYARQNPPVDLVLTDMAMPIMDGPATIIALREINPAVRIVGASGLGSNNKFVKALGAGLKHFLHKPYTAELLLQTVRRALEDKVEENLS